MTVLWEGKPRSQYSKSKNKVRNASQVCVSIAFSLNFCHQLYYFKVIKCEPRTELHTCSPRYSGGWQRRIPQPKNLRHLDNIMILLLRGGIATEYNFSFLDKGCWRDIKLYHGAFFPSCYHSSSSTQGHALRPVPQSYGRRVSHSSQPISPLSLMAECWL